MPKCSKCGKNMDPKLDLTGDVAEILRVVAREADTMRWRCPGCGLERGQPLKSADDVKHVESYVRRMKKQWWQFWIR
jgi:DNA-directed RNA polymerase subunit RPC12/RpoP